MTDKKKRGFWTDEQSQVITEIIKSSTENGVVLTLSDFLDNTAFGEFTSNSIKKKVRDTAFEMGYNVSGIFSAHTDKAVEFYAFDEGDIEVKRAKGWGSHEDEIVLGLMKSGKMSSLEQIIRVTGTKATNTEIIKFVKAVAKQNKYHIKGIMGKIGEGYNRLTNPIEFKSKDEASIEYTPKPRNNSLIKYLAYVNTPGGVTPVAIKAMDIQTARKNAEALYGTVVSIEDAKSASARRVMSTQTKELV